MDVFLVQMPFRLAVFGANRAEPLQAQYAYAHWYIGGHSLGGAVAANYAAAHGDRLSGLILLAAYPTKPLSETLTVLSIYGSEDGVLDPERVAAGRAYVPTAYTDSVIDGGNHAQFGNYGAQSGDGAAHIPAEEQQQRTVALIVKTLCLQVDAAA